MSEGVSTKTGGFDMDGESSLGNADADGVGKTRL